LDAVNKIQTTYILGVMKMIKDNRIDNGKCFDWGRTSKE